MILYLAPKRMTMVKTGAVKRKEVVGKVTSQGGKIIFFILQRATTASLSKVKLVPPEKGN